MAMLQPDYKDAAAERDLAVLAIARSPRAAYSPAQMHRAQGPS